MKILVDTNVILDVLCNRSEFVEASSKVWKYCEVSQIEGYISAFRGCLFCPLLIWEWERYFDTLFHTIFI